MPQLGEINIRDPFIVPIPHKKQYVMFGTNPPFWQGRPVGFQCYISSDLTHWSDAIDAWIRPDDFWADRNFWAPEVHHWKGKWYLFATLASSQTSRGTQIFVADDVTGPYRPLTEGPVTPKGWTCLDGSLFIDEQDQPWMVFCHEWVQIIDGAICARRLSADFKNAIGDPVRLFTASQTGWPTPAHREDRAFNYVTDGPWLHRLPSGELLMIWSSHVHGKYTAGIARSKSGSILGPWSHDDAPLFPDDGGHTMIFRDFQGKLMLSLHQPNDTPNERARFVPLRETSNGLELAK